MSISSRFKGRKKDSGIDEMSVKATLFDKDVGWEMSAKYLLPQTVLFPVI